MRNIEDWANKLAEEKTEKRKLQRLLYEMELRDRRLVKGKADHAWVEICKAIQQHIEVMNAAMGGEEVMKFTEGTAPNSAFITHGKTGAGLVSLNFDPIISVLIEDSKTYELRPCGNSNVAWHRTNGRGGLANSETLAEEIVERAFKLAD